jgi:multiple antibiotic resistance protein
MEQISTLFIVTFTTLLAMINPLESLPVFLKLLEGKDEKEHRLVARRSCIYATAMMMFFLLFGTLVLKIFGVPLSMVRIAGGIILVRIGFDMFMPSSSMGMTSGSTGDSNRQKGDVAFVPLSIPLMFGPGALATVLGMSAMVKNPISNLGHMAAIMSAIVATMFVTYLALAYAQKILGRIGDKGVDAATRLVGFFVSAMGMGLVFHGLIEVFQVYGVIPMR